MNSDVTMSYSIRTARKKSDRFGQKTEASLAKNFQELKELKELRELRELKTNDSP